MRSAYLFNVLAQIWILLAAATARSEDIYATSTTGQFYRIDSSSFAVTELGAALPTLNYIGGLVFDEDGELYGLDIGNSPSFWLVDPTDGSLSVIGPFGVGFVFEGGLSFDPTSGVLYGCTSGDASSPNLLTIDPATGLATEVGEIASPPHDFSGLAFDSDGELYGIDGVSNTLWRIDKNNPGGAGTFQIGAPFGSGIVVTPSAGMTLASNGEMIAYAGGSGHLFTIDLTTGQGTTLTQLPPSMPVLGGLAIFLSAVEYQRGDANQDGAFDVTDIVVTLSALFDPATLGLPCADAGDCNDDGVLDVSDPVFGLIVLFGGVGTLMPEPAGGCGSDPTDDPLPCLDPLCP